MPAWEVMVPVTHRKLWALFPPGLWWRWGTQRDREGLEKVVSSLRRDLRSSRSWYRKGRGGRKEIQPKVSIDHLAMTVRHSRRRFAAPSDDSHHCYKGRKSNQGQPHAAVPWISHPLPSSLPKRFAKSSTKPQASPQAAPKPKVHFGKPQPPPVWAHFHHPRVALRF